VSLFLIFIFPTPSQEALLFITLAEDVAGDRTYTATDNGADNRTSTGDGAEYCSTASANSGATQSLLFCIGHPGTPEHRNKRKNNKNKRNLFHLISPYLVIMIFMLVLERTAGNARFYIRLDH
jgi:hypothetical protein